MKSSAVLYFSGKGQSKNPDWFPNVQVWKPDIIDTVVDIERQKKLLPERLKNVEVLESGGIKYTPTPTYWVARNLFTKKFRRKRQPQPPTI